MNNIFHFNCTQCGKCCSKPPHVNFFEMLELSDKFIFQISHNTKISKADNPLPKSICQHYQTIAHTIMLPELDSSMFYFIDFIPIQLNSLNHCEQLDNKLCKIYGSRPNRCRLSPFSSKYDDTEQIKAITLFKESAIKNNWECSFNKEDNLLYKDNDFVLNYTSNLYYQEISNIRTITDKYIEYISANNEESKNNHFKNLFNSVKINKLMVTSVIIMLECALYYSLIDNYTFTNFIKNQISLLNTKLNYFNNNLIENDLEIKTIYENILKEYKNINLINIGR